LGRYHDIYEEPREILLSIPRLKFTELDRKREEGFRYVGSEWYLKETPTERMVEKAKERVRGIIDSTPIVKFLADVQRREGSFCCGGGGGRCWMEETGTRISHLRTDDAIRAEAEVLAVACPFCMIMFEDAVKAKEVEEKLRVMDIAELVAQVIA
jgi:Fe-S oxidoreductase